jgi:integrase/recombinase XerD
MQGGLPCSAPRAAAPGELTGSAMHRVDAWRMIRRLARDAGLDAEICCHTFRATGITADLDNSGTLENAQAMAAHDETLRSDER